MRPGLSPLCLMPPRHREERHAAVGRRSSLGSPWQRARHRGTRLDWLSARTRTLELSAGKKGLTHAQFPAPEAGAPLARLGQLLVRPPLQAQHLPVNQRDDGREAPSCAQGQHVQLE